MLSGGCVKSIVTFGFVSLFSNVLLPLPFAFNPATLASLLPAWSAARVRIADTLRYE